MPFRDVYLAEDTSSGISSSTFSSKLIIPQKKNENNRRQNSHRPRETGDSYIKLLLALQNQAVHIFTLLYIKY